MQLNLVLSGGGVRGFAHLGVIKALTESGYSIKAISGTSSGAVTGAFIAAGYSPDETLKLLKDYKLLQLLRGAFNSGLFSMRKFEQIYKTCFPDNSFEKLNFPLYISSTNLYSGRTDYFNTGDLIPALLASTSVPVLFKPVHFKDQLYLDGGILNNLPVEPLLDRNEPIIGVHVNPVGVKKKINSALHVMERSFNLTVHANVIARKLKCDFVFEPDELTAYSFYSYSKADEIFKIGYSDALKKMPDLKIALQKSTAD